MPDKNLKKFVREQAIKGTNPSELRDGLILNGWNSKDVDKAISEAYGLKKKIKTTGLLIIVLLIIIFTISLLLLFTELFYSDTEIVDDEPEEVIDEEPEQIVDKELEELFEHRCASKQDIFLKEACYLEEVETGYKCEDLNNEELFFCNRVLESYLIGTFS